MKKLIIIILLYSSAINAQEAKYFAYNTISSGLIGGIGSGLNKHKGQSFFQAFKKGFVKGCVGGTLNYTSKYMLSWQNSYSDNLNWRVFWSSKIVNSISNTIIYNAANNNDTWLGHYAINVGFLRFSMDHKVQIDAISALCMGYIFTTGAKLNIERSLIVGMPSFDYKWERIYKKDGNCTTSYPDKFGYALGQNVVIQENVSHSTLKHEIIHTYQRLQYQSIVPIKKYENISIFHLDVSIFDVLYFSQNKTIGYKNNLFEYESDYFSM